LLRAELTRLSGVVRDYEANATEKMDEGIAIEERIDTHFTNRDKAEYLKEANKYRANYIQLVNRTAEFKLGLEHLNVLAQQYQTKAGPNDAYLAQLKRELTSFIGHIDALNRYTAEAERNISGIKVSVVPKDPAEYEEEDGVASEQSSLNEDLEAIVPEVTDHDNEQDADSGIVPSGASGRSLASISEELEEVEDHPLADDAVSRRSRGISVASSTSYVSIKPEPEESVVTELEVEYPHINAVSGYSIEITIPRADIVVPESSEVEEESDVEEKSQVEDDSTSDTSSTSSSPIDDEDERSYAGEDELARFRKTQEPGSLEPRRPVSFAASALDAGSLAHPLVTVPEPRQESPKIASAPSKSRRMTRLEVKTLIGKAKVVEIK
jgi:hypothetical protein